MPFLRALGVWLIILMLAFMNGALRELVLLPQLGAPRAFWLSGALLCLCVLIVTRVFLPRLHVRTRTGLLSLGMFWLLLTLAFEFGFGRLVQGRSWHELLAAYTFADGNLWPLVLLVILLAPLLLACTMRTPATKTGS